MIGRNHTQGATLPVYRFDEMQVLSKEQVRKFLASASHSSSYAFFHLALVTGMRMGELLGLKWSDIDWESGTITMPKAKTVCARGGVEPCGAQNKVRKADD